MGKFELVTPEEIIQLINNFDKTLIGTVTTSPVRNITTLQNLLRGEVLQ